MPRLAFLAALLLTAIVARAEIKTETVEYKHGDATLKGYLAYDDAQPGERAGVLVLPEWWGVDDYVKGRARQLAELGYVAFVADIYGDGFVTQDPKVAGERSGEAKKADLLRTRGQLGLDQLTKHQRVDATRTAAIGYCFGGSGALELARAGADLKAAVSFHGSLDTTRPAQKGSVKPKILILHGADDPMVPQEQVKSAEQEFKDAGADVKVVQYPGAVHSFSNPASDQRNIPGVAYNKPADEKSWEEMKSLLKATLDDKP